MYFNTHRPILIIFSDERGKTFKFLKGRDGPPRYSILNFQRTGTNMYQWIIVGNYTCKFSKSY